MSGGDPEFLLKEAIPGAPVEGARVLELSKDLPGVWEFWQGQNAQWAAFIVVGEHLSSVDRNAIVRARKAGLVPVAILSDFKGVRALGPFYWQLRPYVIHKIAGKSVLIAPPKRKPRKKPIPPSPTRVPLGLLQKLVGNHKLPESCGKALTRLAQTYAVLARRNAKRSRAEERALLQYAKDILGNMGLRPERIEAARMLLSIEQGGLGSTRDHFFHSFQNYFFGLKAILELQDEFERFRLRTKLLWDVDPFHVWFLTALWHDVGYSIQKFDRIIEMSFGEASEDDAADILRQRFLERGVTQKALRQLSSLIAHLMKSPDVRTQWMEPHPQTKLGTHANQLRDAMCRNVMKSHGAAGALRLYCDYIDDLDTMDPDRRAILLQTVLLACASIPFHDWQFRAQVRELCGECKVHTTILPYAALLSFVDSIQDDRRELVEIKQAVVILKQLLVRTPAVVTAEIDIGAIDDGDFLSKVIEAHDVLGCLNQTPGELSFKYPTTVIRQ